MRFHSQGPRLETLTWEHLETGWGYVYILGIFDVAATHNVSGGLLWSDCDGWAISTAHTWALLPAQVEKSFDLVRINQAFIFFFQFLRTSKYRPSTTISCELDNIMDTTEW